MTHSRIRLALCLVTGLGAACAAPVGRDAEGKSADAETPTAPRRIELGQEVEGTVAWLSDLHKFEVHLGARTGTPRAFALTVEISGADQAVGSAIDGSQGWQRSAVAAWAWRRDGEDNVDAELSEMYEANHHRVPLERRYMLQADGGRLVIWLGARSNPNDIEYKLEVVELAEAWPGTSYEVVVGVDADNDGVLDESALSHAPPFLHVDDETESRVYQNGAFEVTPRGRPLVTFVDALQLDPARAYTWLEKAAVAIPIGRTVELSGCVLANDEHKDNALASASSPPFPTSPVICTASIP